jgi:hypothetical protein
MTEEIEARAAEYVARRVDRRTALRRSAQAVFGVVSAWAIGGPLARDSTAHTLNGQAHCAYLTSATSCTPPGIGYCSGCNGHECPSGYHWTTITYPSACWCTNVYGSYYRICCDCHSDTGSTYCGCSQVVRAALKDGAPPPPNG